MRYILLRPFFYTRCFMMYIVYIYIYIRSNRQCFNEQKNIEIKQTLQEHKTGITRNFKVHIKNLLKLLLDI